MNTLAALILIVMAGGHPADARAADARPADATADRADILLAQASTPPPGPMSPPSVSAPAPPPKIDSLPDGPPLGSLSLSQLMLKVEGEPEFAYVSAVDWRDGKYAVTYVTRDGQSHEKVMDPRTGREAGRSSQTDPNQMGAGSTPDSGAGNTGDAGGSSPVLNPPGRNQTGTPSNAPSTAPRPAGPTR